MSESNVHISDEMQALLDPALSPFYHGVASGDPTDRSVVIWTRVHSSTTADVRVDWFVARDSSMQQVVRQGQAMASEANDHTVKVDVGDLEAGRHYYYQFRASDGLSPVGRTKTQALNPDRITLAVVSCSNYEWGYFAAYKALAKYDIDAVLHLGDYIYEYAPGTYGDTTIGRKHLPPIEILTLGDYRTRYAQYRLDKDLQEAHRLLPFITVWDDHEITNDATTEGAQNHQSDEGSYADRKTAAQKAYAEWMPVRYDPTVILYRSFRFGDLAHVIMLDERLEGRTNQKAHVDEIDVTDTSQRMLGETQLAWMLSQLSDTISTWKIIGNQVIFSEVDRSLVFPDRPRNLDAWDGYPHERRQILAHLRDASISNVVFVTGDTHSSWAFHVPWSIASYVRDTSDILAVEIGTPSINSSNYDEYTTRDTTLLAERFYRTQNPHLKYVNLRDHGFTFLHIRPDAIDVEWHYVESTRQPESQILIGQQVRLRQAKKGIAWD